MGAEYISAGWTVDSKLTNVDPEVIRQFEKAILDNIEEIDYSGYLDLVSGSDEEVVEQLIYALASIKEGNFPCAAYEIPDTKLQFFVAGAETWGDGPFEDFDIIMILINAVECVPGLGEAIGILGGGIRLKYPRFVEAI